MLQAGPLRHPPRVPIFARPVRFGLLAALVALAGCDAIDRRTDQNVVALIRARQQGALSTTTPPHVGTDYRGGRPGREAYDRRPSATPIDLPPDYTPTPSGPVDDEQVRAIVQATTQPTDTQPSSPATAHAPTTNTAPSLDQYARQSATQDAAPRMTLTRAWAYAQQYRREYQTAKEDLYLAALAVTLERHLWTPIFSANLRTVYGNFGEATNFDQAMRFVADLGVSQRLPYGGEFTAQAISTLIRDVKKTITAEESGQIQLGLNVPFLRGAGHVAKEELIQLERELTYAVRTFERFRRQQMLVVAQSYFDLLRFKQQVLDNEDSVDRAKLDYDRARLTQEASDPRGEAVLDTLRAEQRLRSAESSLYDARENFRSQADRFKLVIGMPVNAPMEMDDLETISAIEAQVVSGAYPLLRPPPAVQDEAAAVVAGLSRRFELRTTRDRVDDARRGVAINRNALLPELNLNSTLTFDTDEEHYGVAAFTTDHATWRSELLLSLPLERMRERVALRRSLVDLRAAQRGVVDAEERVRAEVRRAVNEYRLQEYAVAIQEENLKVAERRAEYAQIQFENGRISNRDKVEAETELLAAQNALNQAKTSRWTVLLEFLLATETLVVEDDGTQIPADLPGW